MRVEPLQHLVLIEIQDKPHENMSRGVNLITKSFRDKDFGEVIEVGDDAKNELSVGDKVFFRPDSGTYIDLNGKKCIMTELGFIYCKLEL